MRGSRLAALSLAIGSCVSTQAICHSQTVDNDSSGSTLHFQANVGSGYNCGRVSSPLYCNGIPVNIGSPNASGNGSFWLDTYVTGSSSGKGFIAWNGVEDLGQAQVTGNISSYNSAGQVTSLQVNFAGTTNDGDGQTYTGTMKLTFTYYYSGGGGGRGGGGAGWRFICTGGSINVLYQ